MELDGDGEEACTHNALPLGGPFADFGKLFQLFLSLSPSHPSEHNRSREGITQQIKRRYNPTDQEKV